ncbi:MAG TPA: MFS transporter [Candidatus Dormibacteraeota bacterium]|nr:MFS transporter [Candidatus Dormibacteraeota bacterium]
MTAAPVAARQPRRRLNHLDFVVLSLYWVAIGYLWNSLTALILPDMIIQFVGRANEGTASSLLKSMGTLVAVIWQPIVGGISDRTVTRWGRRRPFIAGGTIGDLLFLAGIALAGNYWWVAVLYFFLQFSSNTAQAPYQGLLPDVVPERQRGHASGYYGVANLAGIASGTVGAGVLLARYGRGAAILSIALVLVTTMLATIFFVPDRRTPVERQFQSLKELLRKTFGVPLRNVNFVWLMVSRLLIFMGFGGLQNYAFFYFDNVFFHHDRKATTLAATTLLGIAISVAALVSWPASRVSDRTGRRPLIFVAGLAGAVGSLVLVFSHYQWLPGRLLDPLATALKVPDLAAQATLTGVLIGLGLGVFFSVDWAFIQDTIPPHQGGLYMGFSNIATAGAGIAAVAVGGPLLDIFNRGPLILGLPGGFPVVFGLFVVWFVIGSLSILKVPERRRV